MILSLFKGLPRVEPEVFDSTAVMKYKECPRKYFFRLVLGYDSKTTQPYFAWGTAYHKFREELEIQFRKLFGDEQPAGEYKGIEQCFPEAYKRGMAHWAAAGVEPAIGTKFDFMTTERLETSFKIAFQHWKKEKNAKRHIVLETEQSFIIALPDGTPIAGRADQIIRYNGKVWGRDFKTTSKTGPFYERTLHPNDQFTRYTYAESQLCGERVQGQIVEVLYNSKREGPKILTFTTSRNDWDINNWLRDHKFWMDMIHKSREEDHYPANEKSCAFCEYHSVCTQPGESSMKHQLQSYFKFSPWDCTKVHNE